jgi:hypothetical protein
MGRSGRRSRHQAIESKIRSASYFAFHALASRDSMSLVRPSLQEAAAMQSLE